MIMSDLITKDIEEKRAQTEEIMNKFLSQTEPPEISLGDTSEKKDEEEKKDNEEQTDELEQAFDITRHMAKVYTSESKGSVYAAFRREGITMRSDLALVVKYPDGRCSEAIIVNQDLIFDMTFQPVITDKNCMNWVKNAKCLEILRRYSTPNMKIDYVQIFCTLRKNYDKIPVIEYSNCTPLTQVYRIIVKSAKDSLSSKKIPSTCQDYPLTREELKTIAEKEGYDVDELISQMALCNILDTMKNRLQKSIRSGPDHKGIRYYVFKNESKLLEDINTQVEKIEIPSENKPKQERQFKKSTIKW